MCLKKFIHLSSLCIFNNFKQVNFKNNENLLERIILNLLSNSVKYGKDGGTIEVNICKKDKNSFQLSVKDDGIGIPTNSLDRIFERFEKVDKSISRNTEGSGIGLYLVKSFVEMQNGTISINSEINSGTEILISFPIVSTIHEAFNTIVECELLPKSNIIEKIDIEFSDIYIYKCLKFKFCLKAIILCLLYKKLICCIFELLIKFLFKEILNV